MHQCHAIFLQISQCARRKKYDYLNFSLVDLVLLDSATLYLQTESQNAKLKFNY